VNANLEGGDDLGRLAAEPGVAPGAGRLAPGQSLAGGRFQIVGLIARSVFGEVYRATDRSSGQPIALRVIHAELARDREAEARLRQVVTALERLEHKNVSRLLEAGQEDGLLWVTTEYVDGQTLRALLSRKRSAGAAAFSLKGAYNVIAHVCNGMTYAHQATHHGALSASNVLVNSAGRVKITEFGLSRAFPGFARQALSEPADLAAVAPEMATAPQAAGPRADVYSIGAILYELVTGREPSATLVRPSQAVPGLPAEIDQLLTRCLAPNPNDRFPDVVQVKSALAHLVEMGGQRAQTLPPRGAPPGPTPHASGAKPRASGSMPSALPPGPAPLPGPAKPPAGPASPARPGASRSGISVADESDEKWLIQKEKLDFGPFSFAQVKEQIVTDQILPGHIIIDNDSAERCPVEEHPLLHDLVVAAEQRRDDLRRAHAEVKLVKHDKRKGAALYLFIALGIGALGVGAYVIVKATRKAKHEAQAGDIKELDSAQLANFTLAMAQPAPRKAGGSRSGGNKRPSGTAGAPSGGFDDALDLGDASDGEDSERLDNSQINPVLQRWGSKLGACLPSSRSRRASIEFIIGGNGKVNAVRVNGQTSGDLAACVRGVMSKMQFPTFNGPRTRAQFDMSL
jgi:serine/threonine protein kinase